jgi:peptide/nickel transport system substrate-binding protein
MGTRTAGIMLATVLLLWGIGIAGAPAAIEQKGTLTVALDTLGAQTMDPILETRAPHAHYQAPVYDSIVWFDPVKGGIGPGVAERWEMGEDGKSWTFYIRQGHRWHNGDPVTAHDVKFSLERTMSQESLASRAAGLRREVDRIDVLDDYTVRIYTNGTLPYLPEGLSRAVFQEGQLMPKKYIETVGVEEFRKKPIGSGPWKFVRMVPGDRVEYEAVDYPHWRGTPNFKRLVILLVPEESTRVAMVSTGEAAIGSISPESLKEVKAARLRPVTVPGTMQAVFQFYGTYRPEVKGSPVTDVRVREALSLAIDRQQIIDHVMDGLAQWPMPFATFRYSVDMDIPRWESWAKEAFRYDPERAKKLLAEAGYPDGFQLTFWNTALPGTPFMTQIGEAVAGFWQRIGVKVDLKTVEWGTFPPMERGDQKNLIGTASMYRTAGRPVALPRYNSGFHSTSTQRLLGSTEHPNAVSQEFDQLNQDILNERDDAKRTAKMNRMIELVANTWIGIPIIEGMGYWAVNPKLVGQFNPIPGRHEFGDVFERMPRPEQKAWQ